MLVVERFRLECTASPNTTLAILLRFKRLGRSSDAIPAALVALLARRRTVRRRTLLRQRGCIVVSNGVAAALEGVLLGCPGADRMVPIKQTAGLYCLSFCQQRFLTRARREPTLPEAKDEQLRCRRRNQAGCKCTRRGVGWARQRLCRCRRDRLHRRSKVALGSAELFGRQAARSDRRRSIRNARLQTAAVAAMQDDSKGNQSRDFRALEVVSWQLTSRLPDSSTPRNTPYRILDRLGVASARPDVDRSKVRLTRSISGPVRTPHNA